MFTLIYREQEPTGPEWMLRFTDDLELDSVMTNVMGRIVQELPMWIIERLLRFGPDTGWKMAQSALYWQFAQWGTEGLKITRPT